MATANYVKLQTRVSGGVFLTLDEMSVVQSKKRRSNPTAMASAVGSQVLCHRCPRQ